MQDTGTAIKCNICGNTCYMYQDTHGMDLCSVGGKCPTCSYFLSARINRENVEYYLPDEMAANRIVTEYLPYHPEGGA